MDCDQITQVLVKLEATRQYFRICLPIDQLYLYDIFPNRTNIFIILTKNENKEIGHFVLVFVDKNDSIIIFDPLGTNYDGIPIEIKKCIPNNYKTIKFNEKRLQSPNSCLCGLFCIFFSVYLSVGYSFEQLISWFAEPQWNEVSVYSWFVNRVAHRSLTSVLTLERMFHCEL